MQVTACVAVSDVMVTVQPVPVTVYVTAPLDPPVVVKLIGVCVPNTAVVGVPDTVTY